MDGSSARSSRVSAPAYRSPDASPHDSSTRAKLQGTGTFEELGIDRLVERDVRHPALEHRLAAAEHPGRERHLNAVDRTIVAELLLDERTIAPAGDVRLLRDQARIGRDVQHDRLEPRARQLDRVPHGPRIL